MSRFRDQSFTDVSLEKVGVRDSQVRGAYFESCRMRGVELVDIEISGELRNVVVNGVDIGELVEAELNRRMPDRARMRPDDRAGFREAWPSWNGCGTAP